MAAGLLTLAISSVVVAGTACPLPELGETARDCPWAAFSRRLTREASEGKPIAGLFEMLAPEVTSQLRADAKSLRLKELWDTALNREPTSGEEIVDPRILRLLANLMGVPSDQLESEGVIHAGLQNTYGHLFSLLPGEDGFRRGRWVQGCLEQGFGLPAGLLGPMPRAGTLFRNATYFFGRLALADSPEAQAILDRAEVPEALRSFAYDQVAMQRLEERVHVPQVTGREIQLRTDLVTFTTPCEGYAHLVIYSLYDPGEGVPKLVGGFPLRAEAVEPLLAEEALGEDQVISSRFEAYVEGLTGSAVPLSGSRRLISVH